MKEESELSKLRLKKRLRILIILAFVFVVISFVLALSGAFQIDKSITANVIGSDGNSIVFAILTDFDDFEIDTREAADSGRSVMCLDLRGSPEEDNSVNVNISFEEEIMDLTGGNCLSFETDCDLIVGYYSEDQVEYSQEDPLEIINGMELYLLGRTNDGQSMHSFILEYDCKYRSCNQEREVFFQLIEV